MSFDDDVCCRKMILTSVQYLALGPNLEPLNAIVSWVANLFILNLNYRIIFN